LENKLDNKNNFITKMRKIKGIIANFFDSVPNQVRKKKWLIFLITIIITGICVVSLQQSKFDFTIESWFEKDDPVFVAFNEYHAQFGSEDGVYIAYKPKDGDVFSVKSLETIKGIYEELLNYRLNLKEGEESPLDHIVKVHSLINASVLIAEEDMLISRQLIGDTIPIDPEALEIIREIAKSQKNFPLQYFSEDMKYGGMYLETDFGAILLDSDEQPAGDMIIDDIMELNSDNGVITTETPRFKPTDMADYVALNSALKTIFYKPEYTDHLEFYPVGNTSGSEYQNEMAIEMGIMYLAALLVIILLLWFFFGSFSAVSWPLTIVILSTIWTLGIATIFGLPFTNFLILTVILILTIGIADAVHILSGYMFFRRNMHDHNSAFQTVYKQAGFPMLITAITNMVGMYALNISDLVPVQNFAYMSTLGIFLAFIFTVFLLPALIDFWPPVSKHKNPVINNPNLIGRIALEFSKFSQKMFDKIVPFVERYTVTIIILFSLFFAICLLGTFRMRADTSLTGYSSEDSKWNQSIRIIDEKLAGSSRMALFLDLKKEDALMDPQVLNVIDELQKTVEKKYSKYVVTTSSITDVVKDSYQKLNDNKEDKYIIPLDERELSQTLFLFNNADPEQRRKLVDDNYQKANITISLHNYGSYEYTRVFDQMIKDVQEAENKIKEKYPDAFISITGAFVLAMKTADYLTKNEFESFILALAVISIILLVVFGSLRAGLIAIIPNLIPSILAFGLMGLLDIPLDFFTMMLAPVIIGISVDDTTTFISYYRFEVAKDGDIKRALTSTLKEAGQAILFTTFVLGFGFGVMSFASSAAIANVGKFGSLAIFSGLVNDLFLTPALIMVFNLTFQKKKEKSKKTTI